MTFQQAFKNFSSDYRANFFHFRGSFPQKNAKRRRVNKKRGQMTAANEIAVGLHQTLRLWGAGSHGENKLKNVQAISNILNTRSFIKNFRSLPPSRWVNTDKQRKALKIVLECLRNVVRDKKPSWVYPTKALMLLWPQMPAFDSRVRTGMSDWWNSEQLRQAEGWKRCKNRDIHHAEVGEIIKCGDRLHEQFWDVYKGQALTALNDKSQWDKKERTILENSPGRLMDMYFFEAGKKKEAASKRSSKRKKPRKLREK